MSGPLSDVGLQTGAGSPDFSFLQQNLYRSNQQYEQGLSQVKNDYSSILNAPLTDDANIDQRKQYIAQVQEGLKKIAPTDLSLPQNVAQAENLYAPFWQDEYMLKDMGYTRQIQNEFQKAYSARDSKDKDQHSTFDEASLGPLNNAYKDLKTAGRDPNAYKNLSVPTWTPFIDTGQYMSQFKEKEKPEIDWDDNTSKPGYIVKHINGAETLPGWTTMVAGKFDKRFDPQLNVLGQNEVNSKVDNYIANNPGATKDQARQFIAQSEYDTTLDNRKKAFNQVDAAYNDYTTRLAKLNEAAAHQAHGLVGRQLADKQLYETKLNQRGPHGELSISEQREQAKQDYEELQKPDSLPNMTKNLENYFAGNIRNQMISGYAKRFSEDASTKIETDPAYWSAQNVNVQLAQLKESQRYHNIEHEDRLAGDQTKLQIAYMEHPEWATRQQGAISGIPNSRIEEKATNMVSQATPLDLYANSKQNDQVNIANSLYGIPNDKYRGVSQLLLDPEVGITPTELAAFNDIQMRHHLGTLNEDTNGQIPHNALYDSAVTKLSKALGRDPSTFRTVDDVSKGMVDYANKWINVAHNGMTDPDAVKYYTGLINQSVNTYQNFQADEAKRKGMVKQSIVTSLDPDIRKLAVQRPDGSSDVVSQHDIANEFHRKGLDGITIKLPNGHEQEISTDELAKHYWDGTFALSGGGDKISINGNDYAVSSIKQNGQEKRYGDHWYSLESGGRDLHKYMTNNDWNERTIYEDPTSLTHKFGYPGQAKAKLATVESKVVPNYEYWKGKTGEVPMSIAVPITGKGNDANIAYAQDAVLPGNALNVSGEDGKPVSPEVRDEIINTVQHKPELLGDLVHIIPQSSVYGGNKIQISIDRHKADKDVPASVQGKTFTIDIAPDTRSEKLRQIPQLTGEGYDPLYTDPEYANSTLQQTGINYTMRYDKPSNKFLIDGSWTYIDPKTSKPMTQTISRARSADDGGAMGARSAASDMVQQMLSIKTQNQLTHTQRQ